MVKYVHLMHRTFGPGPGQLRGYPGHPELELALLRLYRVTGDPAAYDLARFFLEERGSGGNGDSRISPGQETGKPVQPRHYFDREMELRGDEAHRRPNSYPMSRDYWYCQAHAPIREQTSVEGHAVRATYLLTAVADLLCLHAEEAGGAGGGAPPRPLSAGDAAGWHAALRRLWDSMVGRKMYATGGVGAVAQWEGFGIDYFLPQAPDEGGCYAETCASVGVVMLAERLLRLGGGGGGCGPLSPSSSSSPPPPRLASVADVAELCLYNTVLGSIALDGRAFTYENYLASCPGHLCRREDWFECSCCPPNVSRLFGSLGGYLWHFDSSSSHDALRTTENQEYDNEEEDASINVHLYASARASFTTRRGQLPVSLEQKTNWPWEGNILFTLRAHPRVRTTIRLRVPGWSHNQYTLTPSPSSTSSTPPQPDARLDPSTGYLVLTPAYTRANPTFALALGGFAPRLVAPHPRSPGPPTLSLARGPIVYCVEDVDNPDWAAAAPGGDDDDDCHHFRDVVLDDEAPVREEERTCAGERYVALRSRGWTRVREGDWDVVGSAAPREARGEARELVFVPYYLRANRGGNGHMRVGLLRP